MMTVASQQLLDRFDKLPNDDQRTVAREILRRTADFEIAPLTDDELVQQAEEFFLELDKAEASDAERS